MAVAAPVTQYRKEFIAAFEQRTSRLKMATTKETMLSGNTATFLVSGSGGDTAVTRGTNGQIPYGNPTNNQISATLVEKHAPYEMTGFNIFASQGDQKRIMQNASMAVINRDIDATILAELANATQDFGTGPATVATVIGAKVILGNGEAGDGDGDELFGIGTPAFFGYLMQATEFSSADYVDVKPFVGQTRRFLRWMGINWVESAAPALAPGTASELAYIWRRDALGYAVNLGEEKIFVDYDEKQDVSWSRATIYHAAKILQNSGIVKIAHDGSAFVAT